MKTTLNYHYPAAKFIGYVSALLLCCFTLLGCSKIEQQFSDDAPFLVVPKAVYVIADGSGSGQNQYGVPILRLTAIEQLFDSIAANGGGHLWLNWVDANGDNNRPLHVSVPSLPSRPQLRARYAGELPLQYGKIKKQYQSDSVVFIQKLAEAMTKINSLKADFFPKVSVQLLEIYAAKSVAEDYSDIVPVLNSAFKSLNALPAQHHKVVLAISDLEESLPRGQPTKSNKLRETPDGVTVLRLNATDSGDSVLADVTDIDTYENAVALIFFKN